MPQYLTDHLSTLVQVMAWCRQATSHYLSQCWPTSMLPYDITRPQWVNVSVIFQHWLRWDFTCWKVKGWCGVFVLSKFLTEVRNLNLSQKQHFRSIQLIEVDWCIYVSVNLGIIPEGLIDNGSSLVPVNSLCPIIYKQKVSSRTNHDPCYWQTWGQALMNKVKE